MDTLLAAAGVARVEVVAPWDRTLPAARGARLLKAEVPAGARLAYVRMAHSAPAEARGELSDFCDAQLRQLAVELAARRRRTRVPHFVFFMNDLGARSPHNARTLMRFIADESGCPCVAGFAPAPMDASGGGSGGVDVATLFKRAASKKAQQAPAVNNLRRGTEGGRDPPCDAPSAKATVSAATPPAAQVTRKLASKRKAGTLHAFFAPSPPAKKS